jgi:hypothetical protein
VIVARDEATDEIDAVATVLFPDGPSSTWSSAHGKPVPEPESTVLPLSLTHSSLLPMVLQVYPSGHCGSVEPHSNGEPPRLGAYGEQAETTPAAAKARSVRSMMIPASRSRT